MRLEEFVDPILGKTWGDLGASIKFSGSSVKVGLGYPVDGLANEFQKSLSSFLNTPDLELELVFDRPKDRSFSEVGRVIAVASGKGGVGKSTCAVNVALALEQQGARVGLLDADIYGPSIGMMLGVDDDIRPKIKEEKFFEPVRVKGIRTMSMAFLVNDKTPMVWRGPMASGALQQMLLQTLWGELDYLIVDMPPGTGDIQLTLSQKVAVDGAVIVTTPQDIALQDAIKGIEMFLKVDVPILGIIENMSFHVCEKCGHESHIFGQDGGSHVSDNWDVPLISQVPLAMEIRAKMDSGESVVKGNSSQYADESFRKAARFIAASLWPKKTASPEISVVED